jgi:lipid-A-disaccharide synthase
MPRVLFVAGDLSGDQHAARVAACLKEERKDVEVLALGGPSLERSADRFLGDIVGQGVMGFWEPVKKLPWFYRLLNGVLKPALAAYKPEVVVPVDFFGFNRFTAREANRAGSRVFYFVSPQVWASRAGRIAELKKWVHKILVIFPFEEELYRRNGVPARFVGHPLLDVVPEVSASDPPLRLEPVVGLLPGSRAAVVRRHLGLFLETADKLSQTVPGVRFVLFAAPSLSNDFYDGLLGRDVRRPYLLEIVRDEDYQWRSGLDLALTVSGTSTLENALLGVPMVAVYRTSWLTYGLARALVKVRHIAMPNVLAGRGIVPELIQRDANPRLLAQLAEGLLKTPEARRKQRRELLSLREALGGPGAARRTAREILSAL